MLWSVLSLALFFLAGIYLFVSVWMSGALYIQIQEEWQYREVQPTLRHRLTWIFGMVIFWPFLAWAQSDAWGAQQVAKMILFVFDEEA